MNISIKVFCVSIFHYETPCVPPHCPTESTNMLTVSVNHWGLTILSSVLSLSLGAQGPLGWCWTSKDLGILPPHLETSEGQTAETLGLTWPAQDSSSTSTLLLEGCKNMFEKYYYPSVCLHMDVLISGSSCRYCIIKIILT